MGSVYKAYDRELDRHIAIKVIRPNLVADASTVQRFKQELLLGSKVSHKHILRIHDLGDVEGLKFISMAYVDGEDLHTVLRREGRLPLPRAIGIARQMAQALAAAHAEGVIHRDLKPHNILIDKSGTAYISDFGLAKSLLSSDAAMTRTGELLGTPRYMAPGAGGRAAPRSPRRPVRIRPDPLRDGDRHGAIPRRLGDPGTAAARAEQAARPAARQRRHASVGSRSHPPLPREGPGRAIPERRRDPAGAVSRRRRRDDVDGRAEPIATVRAARGPVVEAARRAG